MNKKLRGLIIELLDDGHGVNDEAYKQLHAIATETGNKDVVDRADTNGGRWFLNEDDAAQLRLTTPV